MNPMAWKEHLDKLGVVGFFIAAACCLGLPAIVAVFAALALGFLINDAVLLPLLLLFFLGVTLFGLFQGYEKHRKPLPLAVGVVSALAALVFIFVAFSTLLAYAAIAGLVTASVVNIVARQQRNRIHAQ